MFKANAYWTADLWFWFPIGPAGISALLLFLSALVIFVLRVANFHFGERNNSSPASTFLQCLASPVGLQTLGFYLASAWWFSEVYIWTAPASAKLNWVIEGR